MPRLSTFSSLSFLLATLLAIAATANAASRPALHIAHSDNRSLIVELNMPAQATPPANLPRSQVGTDSPSLPFFARIFAAPPGVEPTVRIIAAESVEFADVEWPDASGSDAHLPIERAACEYLGVLQGVETHALRLFPYSYNGAKRILRVYTRLRLEVRFPNSAPAAKKTLTSPMWKTLLNADQAASWTRASAVAKSTQDTWYDPEATWIKLHLEEDGIYRVDPAWLAAFADPATVDPRSFRLFYLGHEKPLHVEGEGDGRFDAEDFLVFHGRYRRDDRNFSSLYGRRNTYWLTWGGDAGLRFTERSGTPVAGYPQEHSFWTTAHHERDIHYEALNEAPNDDRDHWFWDLVEARRPGTVGSIIAVGNLPFPDLEAEYSALVRVALHGFTDQGHHTVIKLNQTTEIDDRIWGAQREGQIALNVEREIPSTALRSGSNRLLVQTIADQAKFDWVYLNWFAIDYRRLYETVTGHLEFAQKASAGHRIEVAGLRHPHIELLDIANGRRFTDISVAGSDSRFVATFEDQHDTDASYVISDSLALMTPQGSLDRPSNWRQSTHAADYLVIAHPKLLDAGRRLAAHRESRGLQTALISSENLYDEFTYGRFDRDAIRNFMSYAYHNWQGRPSYILLLGDETWDYRNVQGGGNPTTVPSLYYQSRGRGTAPSDYLYTLVDGDDLLPDFHIGRLAASSSIEANEVVDKIIRYDTEPPAGDWRNRMIYLANHHGKNIFTDPSDSLAARYTEPSGMQSVKIYNTGDDAIPNSTGRTFVNAFNEGALLLNFNGHGSPGTLQFVFSLGLPDWDFLSQIQNGRRAPLVLALSCLNGLFANPTVEGLAEVLVNEPNRGAIAYISASAKSFVAQNNLLADRFYDQFFTHSNLQFGPALDLAKVQVLAAHTSWIDAVLTMQLVGDPAQNLALVTGADYAATSIELQTDTVRGHATLQIDANLHNNGRPALDSLTVMILGHPQHAHAETLFTAVEPPFTGTRTLSFAWPVGFRRGAYRLEVVLDGTDRIAEFNEFNNRVALDLNILEPLLPIPLFPAAGATLSAASPRMEAAVPLDGRTYQCEFAIATAPDFGDESSASMQPTTAGLAAYEPSDLTEGQAYFWRVRLHTDQAAGPWSATRSFRIGEAGPTWSQRGAQLPSGAVDDLVPDGDGNLILSTRSLPLRPSEATREDGFTVRGVQGSGVLVSDGTYLYAKRWYNDDSTLYPGIDYFTRIGTGLNDTFRSGNFGVLADSTTAGISATYHSDGYIYNDSGKAFEIERIRTTDGVLDTVAVPEGLLEWKYGRVENGHSLMTSDGTHIFNVSMSSERGTRTEWRVRVFDPAQDWALVREFTSPPTETGFTFEWTDGILADGERLYLVEWQGQQRIRMIDAFDGTFLDEWKSGQDITRIITGQYDWVNNKVWMGDLWSSAIFRYTGIGQVSSGRLTSGPIGPAARWDALVLEGDGRVATDVLVATGEEWTPHPQLRNLPPGEIDLSPLDAALHPQIRLRAQLADPSAKLAGWSADFAPRPSLELSAAHSTLGPDGLHLELQVRNLGAATDDARIIIQLNGHQTPLRELALGHLTRGETRQVLFDSLGTPPAHTRLFATIITDQPDANPDDNRLEIPLFFSGHIPLSLALWPETGTFISGDPLRPGQGLVIDVPNLANPRIELLVDDQPVDADSTLDAFPAPPRLLWRPDANLSPGRHRLETRIFSGDEEIGRRKITFRYGESLHIANALVYPHPVRRATAFTYMLSGSAEVEIEIYALTGRLIRRLGPITQEPGFQQMHWDGRDQSTAPLANGTYLYRIIATNTERTVVFRAPLVIAR